MATCDYQYIDKTITLLFLPKKVIPDIYGLKSQNVTCRKAKKLGTSIIAIGCLKNDGVSILYDVDVTE